MNDNRIYFEQALGESFGDYVSPPVPFEDASPHECCEVIWEVLGHEITPEKLSVISSKDLEKLCEAFSRYFECDKPSVESIQKAVEATLNRWPIGSL